MDTPLLLADARARAGLTQAELARRSATSQAAVSAYENGRKVPSLPTLERLLAATGHRLALEREHSPAQRPSAARHRRTARGLSEVLALAEALPTRHEAQLRYPRLTRPA